MSNSIAIAILLACPAYSQAADTVRHYLVKAKAVASNWQADAQLVGLQNNGELHLDGVVHCQAPNSGWNYMFYSASMSSYASVFACAGKLELSLTGKQFATPPKTIPATFADSDQLGRKVSAIAKEWDLEKCAMHATLRISGGEPVVDATFPKAIPLWAVWLNCRSDIGGDIFVDARSLKVLKASKHSNKGD
jgi:hypothetical protein